MIARLAERENGRRVEQIEIIGRQSYDVPDVNL